MWDILFCSHRSIAFYVYIVKNPPDILQKWKRYIVDQAISKINKVVKI